jgi:hypothetical protein
LHIAIVASLTVTADASPNLALDHPAYEQLLRAEALGRLPAVSGGFLPLTEARVQELLFAAYAQSDQQLLSLDTRGWWVTPLHRVRLDLEAMRDPSRPYSTSLHPRNVAGGLAASCERTEGATCGHGRGASLDVEAAAGFGRWVSATLRLRGEAGTADRGADVAIEHAYMSGEIGPFAAEVGRDSFALGPRARTQLAWGTHAAPLDHVRVSTAYPWRVADALQLNGQYIFGRLRAPQRFPGNLVSIIRGQADLARSVELGVIQMLQLGGEGAPSLSVGDFLLEHVRRRDITAGSTDSSNRRFGLDVSTRIPALEGLRLYYVLMFEDIRRARWMDAVRYDADHLVGLELAAFGPGRRHGVTIEWHQTGVRSQEHGPRSTGFTNAGRVVGSPLGPDAHSFYVGGRVSLEALTVYPWFELAQLGSDTYQFVEYGPILRTAHGEDEGRYRMGVRARAPVRGDLWLEGEAFFEHINDFGFQSRTQRNNAGVSATMIWYPAAVLGTIGPG